MSKRRAAHSQRFSKIKTDMPSPKETFECSGCHWVFNDQVALADHEKRCRSSSGDYAEDQEPAKDQEDESAAGVAMRRAIHGGVCMGVGAPIRIREIVKYDALCVTPYVAIVKDCLVVALYRTQHRSIRMAWQLVCAHQGGAHAGCKTAEVGRTIHRVS